MKTATKKPCTSDVSWGVPFHESSRIVRQGKRMVRFVTCPQCHEEFKEYINADSKVVGKMEYAAHFKMPRTKRSK